MTKLRHYRPGLLILSLAVVCAPEWAGAKDLPQTGSLPFLNGKQAAKLIRVHSTPDYPVLAKVNYIEGHVKLELTVNNQGKVSNAHVLEGNAVLAASALQATRCWVYGPLDTPSGPSGFVTRVELNFFLRYENRPADLSPREAERDLLRQVRLPQVLSPAESGPQAEKVHMRLLVNDRGQVIDTEPQARSEGSLETVRKILQDWIIRPALWGTLPIASYLDVDVPVSTPPLAWAAENSGRR
jgi:TonB family protein